MKSLLILGDIQNMLAEAVSEDGKTAWRCLVCGKDFPLKHNGKRHVETISVLCIMKHQVISVSFVGKFSETKTLTRTIFQLDMVLRNVLEIEIRYNILKHLLFISIY